MQARRDGKIPAELEVVDVSVSSDLPDVLIENVTSSFCESFFVGVEIVETVLSPSDPALRDACSDGVLPFEVEQLV